MPPRKSAQVDIETSVQSVASAPDRSENVSEEVQRSLSQWTDEQEIALLKAIVRWKPVGSSCTATKSEVKLTFVIPGKHKHFRMIAIHNYMISQGVVNSGDQHTAISGLWTKLESLYNLPILDEREDSSLNSSSDENGSPGKLYHPYDLPDRDLSAMKLDRRLTLERLEIFCFT
jgi:MRG-binding protein